MIAHFRTTFTILPTAGEVLAERQADSIRCAGHDRSMRWKAVSGILARAIPSAYCGSHLITLKAITTTAAASGRKIVTVVGRAVTNIHRRTLAFVLVPIRMPITLIQCLAAFLGYKGVALL